MSSRENSRHLAALMFTDMVGYSALSREHERLAQELVEEQRTLIRSLLPFHGGQEQQTTGDGFFIEFGSVLDAVECAIQIQNELYERNFRVPRERKIQIRIGVHLAEVFSEKNQLFGNGVNIAARIEAQAAHGGVCLTRQVYDQVQEKIPLKIKKRGNAALKNIRGGADLYDLVFPWMEKKSRVLPQLENLSANTIILSGLFTGCAAILIAAAAITWNGVSQGPEAAREAPIAALRSPAGERQIQPLLADHTDAAPRRLDLSTEWSYALDTNGRSPGNLPSPPSDWKDFDPRNAWKYSDQIQGRYWLKKTFEIRYPFEYPAVVLGQISESHRAYLNGHFIGGSDHLGDIAYYVFDPSLLNLEGPNTLLISARTRSTLDPGLTWQPGIGAFLGEFEDVKRTVTQNEIRTQILRTIYFTLSLAVFAACFIFAAFHRERRDYIYCSLFLLLSTIYFSYYNTWVTSVLAYPFLRFLKAFSLTLQPFVLLSAYLHLQGKKSLETFNNGAALGVGLAICGVLLAMPHTPSSYMSAFNGVISFGLAYTLSWVSAAALAKSRAIALPHPDAQNKIWLEHITLGFGALCVFSLLGAWRLLPALHLPIEIKDVLAAWTMAMPFAFSALLLAAAAIDYSAQSKTAERKKSRDQLVLGLIRIINAGGANTDAFGNASQTIKDVHERVARFLKATRSTLYINESEKSALKATFIIGGNTAQHKVLETVQATEGPLWYVSHHRSPLLIDDIRQDLRFKDLAQSPDYRTGSCMIFPLISGDQLVGVLTFADKENDKHFSRDDFAMALEVSMDLALLLDNRRLHESLKKAANSAG